MKTAIVYLQQYCNNKCTSLSLTVDNKIHVLNFRQTVKPNPYLPSCLVVHLNTFL